MERETLRLEALALSIGKRGLNFEAVHWEIRDERLANLNVECDASGGSFLPPLVSLR